MKLIDLVSRLDAVNEKLTIYTPNRKKATPTSDVVLAYQPEDGTVPDAAAGMQYFLEVSVAKEAVEVWSEWRGSHRPTPNEAADAIIYYAKYDAFLPVTGGCRQQPDNVG
jgi:hypothetical protein